MVDVSAVQKLREMTAASILDCKNAIDEAHGDLTAAVEFLRKKGIASAIKKLSRQTKDGLISSYIHQGGKIGVLIELNCETDFVAKTKEFSELSHELSMQIAASSPIYIKREEVPEDVIAKEREIYKEQIKNKPPNVIDKIVDGKMDKYFAQVCLTEQPFIKEPKTDVDSLVKQYIAKLGENISVRRFIRFEVGRE